MAGEPLVTIIGNIVADPELRISQGGKSWVTFRVAQTPRVRDRDSGDWGDGETTWFGCKAFDKLADNIAASFPKGTRVIILGRMSTRTYKDRDGNERSSLELDVEEIGPSVRFATAIVQRGGGGGAAASMYGAPQTQAQGWGQDQSAWGQPPAQQTPPAQPQQPQGQPGWGQAAYGQAAPPAQPAATQQPPAQDNPWLSTPPAASAGFDSGQTF